MEKLIGSITGQTLKKRFHIFITPADRFIVQRMILGVTAEKKFQNGNRVEIVPEAAEVIRLIYFSYLNGMGLKAIARMQWRNCCS